MERTATHNGIVTESVQGTIKVQMHVVSACSTCEAHKHCGFAESRDKIVDIKTSEWSQYKVGDPVNVIIRTKRGLLAVLIAYLLPAALLLATIITLSMIQLSEVWVAIISLLAVILYGAILYLFRNRLQRKFTMSVSPRLNQS